MEDPIELRRSFVRAGRIVIQAQQDANRATGAPMQEREIEARKWLAELDAEDSAKRDAREEETLSIARQARSDARIANIIAIIAIICSAIATIIAAFISIKIWS